MTGNQVTALNNQLKYFNVLQTMPIFYTIFLNQFSFSGIFIYIFAEILHNR